MTVILDTPSAEPLAVPNETLLEVAGLLREVGWVQDAYYDRLLSGRYIGYCPAGAFNAARGKEPGDDGGDTQEFARRLGFKNQAELIHWNDQEGRTADEVIERVERAAYGL